MEEDSARKRRLILTTVHDKQKSVQIDLYNSFAKTMADALYIGSLVVENIKPRRKGEPSIELILASNSKGEISADAMDLDSFVGGEPHHLSVSLTSMEDESLNEEIPDFELEFHDPPPLGLYEKTSSFQMKEKIRKLPWTVLIIILSLILLVGCLLYFFFFHEKNMTGQTVRNQQVVTSAPASEPAFVPEQVPAPAASAPKPVPAPKPPPAPAASIPKPAPAASVSKPVPAPKPAPAPVASAPKPVSAPAAQSRQAQAAASQVPQTRRSRSRPPVASYKVPQTIPRGGASYTVRWGDTLWDISEAFYRNPWLYPRIARFNNIRNPDHIISGKTIKIPPRN
jgi:hypothetical protein